jgi:outer membrane protein assembly factor BamB
VTDGKYLYVSFGHQGTYCFDLAGKTVWSQDGVAAKMRNDWGTAASPVLHGDRLIIVDDNEQQSRLQMLDKTTGNLIWEVKRDENSNWSTPFVWENSLRTEIIVPGTGANRAYDLQGELLYQFSGNSSITIATAYAENDLLYVSSGYVLDSRKPLFAIRPGATGDITLKADQTSNDHIVWCQKNAAPYNPSSLLYQGRIYVLYDRGFIACFAARTGKEIYSRQRINGGRAFTSSPWAYRGHVFCLNEDGETFVLKAGDQYELVGRNRLGEEEMAMATPALAGEQLLVRTADYLYSIGLSPIGQK